MECNAGGCGNKPIGSLTDNFRRTALVQALQWNSMILRRVVFSGSASRPLTKTHITKIDSSEIVSIQFSLPELIWISAKAKNSSITTRVAINLLVTFWTRVNEPNYAKIWLFWDRFTQHTRCFRRSFSKSTDDIRCLWFIGELQVVINQVIFLWIRTISTIVCGILSFVPLIIF